MTPWKTFINTMSLLLLVGIGLAGVFLYSQWLNPPQPEAVGLQSGHKEEVNQNNKQTPFTPAPLSVYQEISERPLFVEGRLPPEKPQLTGKSTIVKQKPLKLRLEGVVITPKSRVAIIRDLSSNRLLRVSQGMNQDDWTLEAVDNASATVTRRGKKHILGLNIEQDKKSAKSNFRLPSRPSNK